MTTGESTASFDYKFSLNKEVKLGMKLKAELDSVILFSKKINFGGKGLLIYGEIEEIVNVQKDKNDRFTYFVKIPNAKVTLL